MITTDRLLLRPWKDEDFQPFAEMNADPRVREFFPSVLTHEKSDAEIRHIQSAHDRDGFTFFATELISTGEFIGFIGMVTMTFAVPSLAQPAVEIGWRLAQKYWGKGLATEGASAVLRYGFETVKLKEIVAITVPTNVRSRRVMQKIGMKHIPELDFDHPRVPEGHVFRRHVLYAIRNDNPS
ncbi:MAG TPA: GNAT family N-acetyltransferase [Candidatus Saccharimonadales bacterium]|jgi:RimJ/RimL family protein N-acetyltransferase|nr:GNAT family N-acetyltransferase [Candidatus Saccharimonadales bacterium]